MSSLSVTSLSPEDRKVLLDEFNRAGSNLSPEDKAALIVAFLGEEVVWVGVYTRPASIGSSTLTISVSIGTSTLEFLFKVVQSALDLKDAGGQGPITRLTHPGLNQN